MATSTTGPRRYRLEDVLTLQISYRKERGRLRLWQTACRLARFRRETATAFLLRAIAREVARCEQELTPAQRLAMQDEDEKELVSLLPTEVREKYGL